MAGDGTTRNSGWNCAEQRLRSRLQECTARGRTVAVRDQGLGVVVLEDHPGRVSEMPFSYL